MPIYQWATLLWALLWVGCFARGWHSGWDSGVYQQAMKALGDGLDPYAVGQAHQIAEHVRGRVGWGYIYPPLTIVILRILNYIPSLPGQVLFWTIYGTGIAGQLWAVFHLARPSERALVRCLLPVAVFFPCFIPYDYLTILSGNVAIPIYGVAWVGAIRGWKVGRWGWFYAAVLAASLFKPPMLTLLVVPVLMGVAEYLNCALVAICGVSQFLVQRLIWPKEFAEYLTGVQLEFAYARGFGCGPAGVLGRSLDAIGRPFATASTVFYLVYALLVFVALASLARKYHRGEMEGSSLLTMLLFGAVLLNPRVMEYDSAACNVPMLLLVARGLRNSVHRWYLVAAGAAAGWACVEDQEYAARAILMVVIFAVGVFGLRQETRSVQVVPSSRVLAQEEPETAVGLDVL